jgi:hypothetical protein
MSLRTTKELVLMHREDTDLPRGTSKWLQGGTWYILRVL